MLRKPTIGHRLSYLALITIESALRLLPLTWVWHTGAALGNLIHLLAKKRRSIVLRNLKLVHPELHDTEHANLAKEVFRRSFANLISSVKTGTMPISKLKKHITINNGNFINNLPKDKGCIFMLFHMGNWEILTRTHKLIEFDKPTAAIFQTLKNPLVDKHIKKGREKEGTHLFSRKKHLKNAAQFVKDGGFLGILSDQNVGKRGVKTQLFGKETYLTPLPSMLSQKNQTPITPVTMSTISAGQWEITFHPPLLTNPEHDKMAAIEKITPTMEKIMRSNSKDIFWLHNLWK